MDAYQSLCNQRQELSRQISQRINDRISARRIAAGCAHTAADSLMWSKADWDEFHLALRPLNRAIRELAGSLGRQSA